MKVFGLLLSFIVELVVFICVGFSGFIYDVEFIAQIVISLLALTVLIIFWATYMSPKAKRPLSRRNYYLSKFIIYGFAVLIIYTLNDKLALPFVLAALVSELTLIGHNASRLT